MDRLSGLGSTVRPSTSAQVCDNCGQPGVLDADRYCPKCAALAHEVDDYGTAVALDLLRMAIMGARAYATRRDIEYAVERALDEYDS